MSIQPIDLQLLYSQLDKVAKVESQQTKGQQIKDAIQQEIDSKKLLQKKATVAGSEKLPDGLSTIKERKNSQQENKEEQSEHKNESDQNNENTKKEVFTDPNLGQNIDVSG
ncbi:MAG: hypothetical protein ACRC5H_05005 [Treponemataceae bacterium]